MKVVSLVPSITETLFELGLDDQIVAVTRWCTRPADKVQTKRMVGGTKNPKIELLAALSPDLVILDCDENRKEDAIELERRGIRTFSFFPKTVDDSIQLIRDLGEMFSVPSRAQSLVHEIEERRQNYRPQHKFVAVVLIWRSPYMSINADTYVHSACELFGFQNAFASHTIRYPVISSSEILKADPEVVLFPDEPYPFRKRHMDAFASEFPTLRAVNNGRLIHFDGSYIAWHGFGTLRALREFPRILENQLA
jgi:iron complex transport system substrate-binding protein